MLRRGLHLLRHRRVRRALAVVALLGVLVACGGVMLAAALARAEPAWWRPVRTGDQDALELARRVEQEVQSAAYRNRGPGGAGETWEIHLSADEATAWLSTRLPLWLANQNEGFRWPAEITSVQVEFRAGEITAGVGLLDGGHPRVLTASVRPRLDDGRLFAPARCVRLGRLAVPRSWLLARARGAAPARGLPGADALFPALRGESALLEEALIRLGDGRSVRILGVAVSRGMVRVSCRTERTSPG